MDGTTTQHSTTPSISQKSSKRRTPSLASRGVNTTSDHPISDHSHFHSKAREQRNGSGAACNPQGNELPLGSARATSLLVVLPPRVLLPLSVGRHRCVVSVWRLYIQPFPSFELYPGSFSYSSPTPLSSQQLFHPLLSHSFSHFLCSSFCPLHELFDEGPVHGLLCLIPRLSPPGDVIQSALNPSRHCETPHLLHITPTSTST